MNKNLQDRLKSYSLSAGAVVAGLGGYTQILYTDVSPDVTLDLNTPTYNLDLDNNNITDFQFQMLSVMYNYSSYFTSAQAVNISPMGQNSVGVQYFSYPYALNLGENIGASMNFSSSTYNILKGQVTYGGPYYSGTFQLGNWPTNQDRYLGLKVQIAGQTHYGWARVTVLSNSSMILRDYAIEMMADESIEAGATFSTPLDTLDVASSIQATDVADNDNGTDLQVQFTKAADESNILEYRVIAVKASQAGSFDLAGAQAMTGSQYVSITPNGNNITTVLTQNSTDSDGDPVTINQPYNTFVYSVADQSFVGVEGLSDASNTVTLGSPIQLEQAQNLVLSALDVNFDERDLELTFEALSPETGLEEYRVIIVKTESAFSFTQQDAEVLGVSSYNAVTPTGSDVNHQVNLDTKDSDGDDIERHVPYRAFVLAIADGTNANVNSLSMVSNEVMINDPLGISNNPNASEPNAYFDGNAIQVQHINETTSWILTDLTGQQISRGSLQRNGSLECQHLAAGTYILSLNNSSGRTAVKIVLP